MLRCVTVWMGTVLAAAASAAEPARPATAKTAVGDFKVLLRPLVAKVGEGDPAVLVLHLEGANGPITTRDNAGEINLVETIKSMTVTVVDPKGRTVELHPDLNDELTGRRGPHPLWRSPTWFLTLADDAPRVGNAAVWRAKEKLPRVAGMHRATVSGKLVRNDGTGIEFRSGEVAFEPAAPGLKTLEQIRAVAREALVKEHGDIFGKLPFQVIDDEKGNRIVRVRGPEGPRFSYPDYAVTVSPAGKVLSSVVRDVRNCIAQGTQILTPDGAKPVERIRVGDRIWGWDMKRGRTPVTVTATRSAPADVTVQIGELRATRLHPVLVDGTWKPAGAIVATDLLTALDGTRVVAGAIRLIEETVEVFDLTVDGPHTYFAGGVVVHNKDRGYSPLLDDVWYTLWAEFPKP